MARWSGKRWHVRPFPETNLDTLRPSPQFYASDGAAIFGRDLDGASLGHLSPDLVDKTTGEANGSGLAAQPRPDGNFWIEALQGGGRPLALCLSY